MDLRLDPDTGDLALSDAGDLQLTTGGEEIVQRLRLRLSSQRGEWLLNTSWGVDWMGTVLGKGAGRRTLAEAELKRVILGTPGVARLLSWSSSLVGRELSVRFEALTDAGEVLEGGIGGDADVGDDENNSGVGLFIALLPGRRRV